MSICYMLRDVLFTLIHSGSFLYTGLIACLALVVIPWLITLIFNEGGCK